MTMINSKYIKKQLVLSIALMGLGVSMLFTACTKEDVTEPMGVDSPIVEAPAEVIPPAFVITDFSPLTGFSGNLITINGEDLQNVESITFPGGEIVLAENFKEHSRKLISVEIPSPVQKGALILNTTVDDATVAIPTEVEFSVLAIRKLSQKPLLAADVIISETPDAPEDVMVGWGLNWSGQPFFKIVSDDPEEPGNTYIKGNGDAIGNSDWVWGWARNGLDRDFGASKSTHNLRIDIKLTKAFGGTPRFFFLINKEQVNLGSLGFGPDDTFDGWFTLEVDLSKYGNLSEGNIVSAGKDWGLCMDYVGGTADVTGLYMDNFRFTAK